MERKLSDFMLRSKIIVDTFFYYANATMFDLLVLLRRSEKEQKLFLELFLLVSM